VVVGEAPGRKEVAGGQPFIGESGQLLRKILERFGVHPDNAYYTNACLCHPPGNETPSIEAIECCRPRLQRELRKQQPTKILLAGASAATALWGTDSPLSIMSLRGLAKWSQPFACNVQATLHPAALLRQADLTSLFLADMLKFSRLNKHPVGPPDPPTPIIPHSGTELLKAVRALGPDIVVDLEATGTNPYRDEPLLIGVGTATEQVTFAAKMLKDRGTGNAFARALTAKKRRIIGHNIRFDAQFLETHMGIRLTWNFDTLLAHYLTDEQPGTHSLKSLARLHFNATDYSSHISDAFRENRARDIPFDTLCLYNAYDLMYAAQLEQLLRPLIDRNFRDLYYGLILPADHALKDIELAGAPVDLRYLSALHEKYQAALASKEAAFRALTISLTGDDVSPRSPAQLSTFLFDQLGALVPRGLKRSTDRRVLERITKPATAVKVISSLRDYRADMKTDGTYVVGLSKRSVPHSNIPHVHPEFLIHGTVTGRLSCRNPNLQNVPQVAGPEIRNAFVAPPGHVLVNIDYAQLELRVAAYLSRDTHMIDAFAAGRDIHLETASVVNKIDPADVTKNQRHFAKYVNFGIVYDRQAPSVAEQVGCTVKEAQAFITAWLAYYADLAAWRKQTMHQAVTAGFLTTPFGRRRRFPLITKANRREVQKQAVNFPIQSTASDICLTALINIHKQYPHIRIPIHDSLLFSLPWYQADEIIPALVKIMETPPTALSDTPLPFTVDVEIGERWGDLHEWRAS
jgi:DNA polymerase-1